MYSKTALKRARITGCALLLLTILISLLFYLDPQLRLTSRLSTARLPLSPDPAANKKQSTDSETSGFANHKHVQDCNKVQASSNIAIAVKTGATEAVEKIPILMLTALRYVPSVMLFSDLDQHIAGYHLNDALKNVPKSAMDGNTDFDFYWKLEEAQKLGNIESMLRQARDPRTPHDLAAWTLDKYKQLHILEELYTAHPDKHWYMMIDADTYVVWENLLLWLEQLPNPLENQLYLGSPAIVGDVQFAHGGSGILLSQAAMHNFVITNAGLPSKWDEPMHDECCGDLIIGTELKRNSILLKPSWPTVNGESVGTLPFGPSHWCQPVVTLHHVTPSAMTQLSNFERSRGNNTEVPVTFSDLFRAFVGDAIPETLQDWDNYSKDRHLETDTYAACKEACEHDSECFQFAHEGRLCSQGYSIHLGEPKRTDNGVQRRSGWLQERITTWVGNQPSCHPVFPWVD